MAQLAVVNLQGPLYQVTDLDGTPYAVRWGKQPTCDCGADLCPHRNAVAAFRTIDGAAHVYFPMTTEQVLDLLGPSWDDVKDKPEPMRSYPIDPYDRAVAIAALQAWGEELRARRRTTTTFDGLWTAACLAIEGLECERTDSGSAAQAFADAAAIVASQAAA